MLHSLSASSLHHNLSSFLKAPLVAKLLLIKRTYIRDNNILSCLWLSLLKLIAKSREMEGEGNRENTREREHWETGDQGMMSELRKIGSYGTWRKRRSYWLRPLLITGQASKAIRASFCIWHTTNITNMKNIHVFKSLQLIHPLLLQFFLKTLEYSNICIL